LVDASFAACSFVTQSLLGMCTSRRMPASTAATMAAVLTAWTCTFTPAFAPSSSAAARMASSLAVGPGTGVSSISPV
jgi:hypothetical protein